MRYEDFEMSEIKDILVAEGLAAYATKNWRVIANETNLDKLAVSLGALIRRAVGRGTNVQGVVYHPMPGQRAHVALRRAGAISFVEVFLRDDGLGTLVIRPEYQ